MARSGTTALTSLTLGLLMASAACGDATRPTAEPQATPSPATEPASTVETTPHRPLRLGEPLTVRLEPVGELLAAIRRLESDPALKRTLRLTLQGVTGPTGEVNLRIFVNTPDAGPTTPLEEPGYVADAGFFPSDGAPAAARFLFDLGQVLASLPPERRLLEDRFVTITLIALPASEAIGPESPERIEIRVQRVLLSAPADPLP